MCTHQQTYYMLLHTKIINRLLWKVQKKAHSNWKWHCKWKSFEQNRKLIIITKNILLFVI